MIANKNKKKLEELIRKVIENVDRIFDNDTAIRIYIKIIEKIKEQRVSLTALITNYNFLFELYEDYTEKVCNLLEKDPEKTYNLLQKNPEKAYNLLQKYLPLPSLSVLKTKKIPPYYNSLDKVRKLLQKADDHYTIQEILKEAQQRRGAQTPLGIIEDEANGIWAYIVRLYEDSS